MTSDKDDSKLRKANDVIRIEQRFYKEFPVRASVNGKVLPCVSIEYWFRDSTQLSREYVEGFLEKITIPSARKWSPEKNLFPDEWFRVGLDNESLEIASFKWIEKKGKFLEIKDVYKKTKFDVGILDWELSVKKPQLLDIDKRGL